MKKFMRIALVFALAGAALVGCTKDYSGDISDLNKQVSGIQSTLTSLQTSVQSAQSAADAAAATANTALSAAKEAASAADLKAVQTALAAAATSADLTAVDAKYAAYIPAIEAAAKAADLEALETAITAAIAATDVKVADLEKALEAYAKKADLDEAVTKLAALETNYIALEARVAALEAADVEIQKLIDANAKGIEANAEAIAALEKKVEDILAGFGVTDVKVYGTKAITAAYGKFTAAGVKEAAKWKGPKAEEIAKIKKGDYVFGTGANEILVQVNPAGADIADAEISLQTSECVEAPIVFGTPVPYDGKLTKTENGLWTLPFVVEEFTEEEVDDICDEFHGAAMALVVDGIRTDYDMSFAISKDVNANAPEDITEKVAEATGKGTFKFAPADAPKILDAYITGVKSEADSLRFGITYDGMSFTYDVEKVKKYVNQEEDDVAIGFVVSYMNLVGTVKSKVNVTLNITYKGDEPADPTVYTFATVAAHDAVAAYTGAGVSAADKETSRDAQSLVISFKEFYDEFAPTKAEKAVWDEDWHAAATIGFYTAEKNSYDEWETKVAANNLVEKGTFNAANSKLTIQFKEDYGTATFAANEFFAAVVTFTNDDEETIKAVVPFKINAPSAAEIAKWYDWNKLNAFDGSVLHIAKTTTGSTTSFKLGDHFEATENYGGVTLLANVDSVENQTNNSYKYTPHVKLQTFNDNANAYMTGKSKAQKEAALKQTEYQAAMEADFKQLRWNQWVNFSVTDSTDTDGCYLTPWYEFATRTGYNGYNNLQVVFDNNGNYAEKYLNAPLKISKLQIKAMGNRVFDIPDLTFQIDGNVVRTNSASFTKALELGRADGTFISLYNALYAPNEAPSEYFGAFTFKDANNQTLKFCKGGATPWWLTNATVTATTKLDDDGNPNFAAGACLATSPIGVDAFGYTSQVDPNGAATEVGGLKIFNKNVSGLNTLPPDVKTIYVKVTIPDGYLKYVLDNGNYTGDYVVEFEIKVK